MPISKAQISQVGLPPHICDLFLNDGKHPSKQEHAEVSSLLRGYEHELSNLEARIALCRNFLAVVRRVPFEVMAQIFEDYMKITGSTNPLSVLCQVCVSWRDIAMSHTPLWSERAVRVHNGTIAGSIRPLEGPAAALQAWAKRAAPMPWSLKVVNPQTDTLQPLPCVPLYLILSSANAKNLQYLAITGDLQFTGTAALIVAEVHSIVVEGAERTTSRIELPSLSNIRKAVLVNVHPNILPHHFSWSQLTHIYLGSALKLSEGIAVLRRTINLQRACIDFETYPHRETRNFGHTGTVPLLHLSELTFLHGAPLGGFFNYGMSWPKLDRLQLWYEPEPWWNQESMRIIRSVKRLHVVAQGGIASLNYFTPILDACSLLTHLTFECITTYVHLFQFLELSEAETRLPHLEYLGIECDFIDEFEFNMEWDLEYPTGPQYERLNRHHPFLRPEVALANMLRSRSPGNAAAHGCTPLKQLTIRISEGAFSDPLAERISNTLAQFEDQLDVHLVRGSKTKCPTDMKLTHWGRGLENTLDDLWAFSDNQ
ncbi:hypothetical protein DFP72DRAFT_557852 [Ephemerocybe angulata]|uniref:F-box domain-containing protein n=1 Tax=Ephemerocybe angulata TaxID=980116 RepID=A0A8H6LUP0_9AGAR|nr:hypothetical protein DFP72DRAFT_229421 [Tulosesus angulatus]KAF6762417.1 hypothetical protein DFP72DRAFT_557852 [Tulosesus angulatus]